MRVLYFTRADSPHDRRFLAALAKRKDAEIFSLRLEGSRPDGAGQSLPEGVTLVEWRGGREPFRFDAAAELAADLKRVLRELKPDVVHAGPIQSAAYLAAMAGAQPLVSMSWGSDLLVDADRDADNRRATQVALDHTRVLLGDCRAVQARAEAFGFPPGRVVLFPWGVDLAHFSPGSGAALRRDWGWEDKFVLLCTRSWEPIYGVDVIARAFVRAAQVHPGLRLALVGAGSQEDQLREILREGGVLDCVRFPGQVSQADLPAYHRAADLYLSASHSDGSSVSLLEAMACGRPALVSAIPGNREWVTPEENGWLFADGDAGALAEGILNAAQLPRERLARIGQANRAVAVERADWDRNQNKLWDAYQMAVDGVS